MLELINKLIAKWACSHDWEQWYHIRVEDDFGGSWTVFHFKCKNVVNLKK